MVETIQRFVAALRRSGVRVSPAEAIDAARAAWELGPEDRAVFRVALRTTLAKTREEATVFDRAFETFFAAPPANRAEGRRGRGAGQPEPGGGRRGRRSPPEAEAPPALRARGASQPPRDVEPRSRPGRLRIVTTSRRPARVEVRSLRDRETRPPVTHPLARGPEASRPRRPRVPSRPAGAEGADPRRLDLSLRLARAEEVLVAREVPRLIREIRLRAGRRYRRSSTGRLWAARLMRGNVGTGGVPFVIPYRRRRPRRPRAIVLVDVSWSVMRASSLFLIMAREFLDGARASIYFLVDRCVEATDAVRRWKEPGTAGFARLLDRLSDLEPKAASDYGRAFFQALHARRGALRSAGRDVLLIVLGDARNNYRDPQAWAFEELAARCRRVIWLVPEPVSRWNTGDSALGEYLPHCDVVCEAMDLAGVARGVEEIVRSL